MPQIVTQNIIPHQISWQKELAQAFNDPIKLLDYLNIDKEKYSDSFAARKLFPLRVPVPFVHRMERGNADDPLLKQVMTAREEFFEQQGFSDDPLKEQQPPLPGLLHKYDNRVLLMLRTACAINCRYCFRRHFPYQDNSLSKARIVEIVDYIEQRPQINEVILSGGDPLMANDQHITELFNHLEPIKHVTRIRIHTRLPIVIPSRITNELLSLFKQTRFNVVMVMHINHANEIDLDIKDIANRLKSHHVTLLNQAVLLHKINDNLTAQVNLSESLFDAGIMPYYLHLLDKVTGASHFDTDEQAAIKLMHQLYQQLPGFLVPKLVREIGGEAHKTPIDLGLMPDL
ncbi:EF-P beta-lysylation protein EpmB [Psychrobium sp. 1_MG-2023]|uniref:EF-P beta-lysylation protein EpmB n=1 Tax=Psychrobium sp. 1_MG-2023 TaxID=3062624 RepID=UPI000C33A3EF|nr:EF-P beta-lysylation protein EpmB [Psychrobium sp. 1_MG-2023]MDP2560844.1 EF-P beta-lysylation protein EpmB [Psychrobium sp. 1_MG-2023]PKF56718.1 EF-P beta-lysylation protein EpmB [Alteromonadales bacterium alter-6D02]